MEWKAVLCSAIALAAMPDVCMGFQISSAVRSRDMLGRLGAQSERGSRVCTLQGTAVATGGGGDSGKDEPELERAWPAKSERSMDYSLMKGEVAVRFINAPGRFPSTGKNDLVAAAKPGDILIQVSKKTAPRLPRTPSACRLCLLRSRRLDGVAQRGSLFQHRMPHGRFAKFRHGAPTATGPPPPASRTALSALPPLPAIWRCSNSGSRFPLLQVGDSVGIELPRGCMTGLCGACTCDLEDPSFPGSRSVLRACSTRVRVPTLTRPPALADESLAMASPRISMSPGEMAGAVPAPRCMTTSLPAGRGPRGMHGDGHRRVPHAGDKEQAEAGPYGALQPARRPQCRLQGKVEYARKRRCSKGKLCSVRCVKRESKGGNAGRLRARQGVPVRQAVNRHYAEEAVVGSLKTRGEEHCRGRSIVGRGISKRGGKNAGGARLCVRFWRCFCGEHDC